MRAFSNCVLCILQKFEPCPEISSSFSSSLILNFFSFYASYAASTKLTLWGYLSKSRATHFLQDMINRGAYILLRRKEKTAVSLKRTPHCSLICRTSSFDYALDRPPLYGRCQGSGSTGPPLFSC